MTALLMAMAGTALAIEFATGYPDSDAFLDLKGHVILEAGNMTSLLGRHNRPERILQQAFLFQGIIRTFIPFSLTLKTADDLAIAVVPKLDVDQILIVCHCLRNSTNPDEVKSAGSTLCNTLSGRPTRL